MIQYLGMPLLSGSSAEFERHHIIAQLDVYRLLWGVIVMLLQLCFTVALLQWLPWSALTRCANSPQLDIWLSGGSLSQCCVTPIFSASSMARKIADTQPQTMFGPSLGYMSEMRCRVFALKISVAFCFLNWHVSVVKLLFNIRKKIGIKGLNKCNLGAPFSSSF